MLSNNNWVHWGLLCLIGFLAYPNNIGFTLFGGSEGLYAQIVREMVTNNQYSHLTFLGQTYLNKPPLFFWILAGFREILGENEIALRLPGAIFSLGTMGVTYALGRMLLSKTAAFWAALVVATTYVFLWNGRHIQFDSILTFSMTLAVYAWARIFFKDGSPLWFLVAFSAMAFGTMIKSFHAFGLPFFLMVTHSLIQRDYRAFTNLGFWAGLVTFGGLVYGYASNLEPQFQGHFHILGLLSTAFAQSGAAASSPPRNIHRYLYLGWFCFFPWSALLPSSLVILFSKRPYRRHPVELFLLLWFFGYLVLFSLAQLKAERYLLPLVPCLGLMIGYYYDKVFSSSEEKQWATPVTKIFIGLLSIAFIGAFIFGPTLLHKKWDVPLTLFPPIYVITILTLCFVIFVGLLKAKIKWSLSLFGVLAVGVMFGVNYLLVPAIDHGSSPKRVDKDIRDMTSQADIPRFQYGLTQEDLIFYLNYQPPFPRLDSPASVHQMAQKFGKIFVVTDYNDLNQIKDYENLTMTVLREYPQPRQRNFFLISIESSTPLTG